MRTRHIARRKASAVAMRPFGVKIVSSTKNRLDGWKIASRVTRRTARSTTLTIVGTRTKRLRGGATATLRFEVKGVTLTCVAPRKRKRKRK
jgi:hypothetical protein